MRISTATEIKQNLKTWKSPHDQVKLTVMKDIAMIIKTDKGTNNVRPKITKRLNKMNPNKYQEWTLDW